MNTSQASASKFRWVIIISAFIIMMLISIYQYSWFLFAYTLEKNFAWNPAAIGMTFTVFAYAATFDRIYYVLVRILAPCALSILWPWRVGRWCSLRYLYRLCGQMVS